MENTTDTTECVKCGVEVCKKDHLETIDGYICEECLKLREE